MSDIWEDIQKAMDKILLADREREIFGPRVRIVCRPEDMERIVRILKFTFWIDMRDIQVIKSELVIPGKCYILNRPEEGWPDNDWKK